MTIQLRQSKGIPLTNDEVDQNFTYLNNQVNAKVNASDYTASDILTKLKTVDGSGSGLDADLLDGLSASSANVGSTIVARDASGNFAANRITAAEFVGPFTGQLTGTVLGNISGTASNVTGIVAIQNGGTGGTTAQQARTNLGLGSVSTQNSDNVSITGGTITGITDLTVADGGTGASTALQARTNLGLTIGTDVQGYDADLTAIAALNANGIIARTGNGSATVRTISAGTGVSISNGDGVSGNPTISIGQAVATTSNVVFNAVTTTSTITSGGNLSVTGTIVASGNITAFSDERLKSNVQRINDALALVKKLNGVTYDKDGDRGMGLIAQNVKAVTPEVVTEGEYLSVAYGNLVGLLVEAIKELSDKVDALSKDVK